MKYAHFEECGTNAEEKRKDGKRKQSVETLSNSDCTCPFLK